MANTTSPSRRGMTAAARAAAKRARRAEQLKRAGSASEDSLPGPAPVIEAPDGRDDPPGPTPEPSPEPSPEHTEERGGTVRRRPPLLVAVLGVLLVAALVAVSVLGWRYREGQRTREAESQAVAAARKAAPVVLSYDYRRLDRDFARGRTLLTGAFRAQYGKTTASVVAPTAEKYHGVVKATVATASAVSASPDRVVVLLFVNQVTRSTQVSGARLDLNRVRMTMSRTAEGWKVSAVDAL